MTLQMHIKPLKKVEYTSLQHIPMSETQYLFPSDMVNWTFCCIFECYRALHVCLSKTRSLKLLLFVCKFEVEKTYFLKL